MVEYGQPVQLAMAMAMAMAMVGRIYQNTCKFMCIDMQIS
jgi:hypothetical protein